MDMVEHSMRTGLYLHAHTHSRGISNSVPSPYLVLGLDGYISMIDCIWLLFLDPINIDNVPVPLRSIMTVVAASTGGPN